MAQISIFIITKQQNIINTIRNITINTHTLIKLF